MKREISCYNWLVGDNSLQAQPFRVGYLTEKPLGLCFLSTTKLANFAFIVDSVITYTLVLSREL